MIDLQVSVHIDAPVETVFGYSTDNQNDPHWMEEVTRVEQTSDGPIGVGSTFRNYVDFMGKTFDDSHEVVEYQPNERMTIVQQTGPVPFKATYLYEPVAGRTVFTMQIEAETKGFFKAVEPIVRRRLAKQFERNLRNLKSLMES